MKNHIITVTFIMFLTYLFVYGLFAFAPGFLRWIDALHPVTQFWVSMGFIFVVLLLMKLWNKVVRLFLKAIDSVARKW